MFYGFFTLYFEDGHLPQKTCLVKFILATIVLYQLLSNYKHCKISILSIFTGCGALKSKWKCTPSRSCDWYKEFVKNLGKYSPGDQKFKELKDFYDDRKCGEGHVYCSSDGKFPRDSGDLPELKRCQLSESPSVETAVQSGGK